MRRKRVVCRTCVQGRHVPFVPDGTCMDFFGLSAFTATSDSCIFTVEERQFMAYLIDCRIFVEPICASIGTGNHRCVSFRFCLYLAIAGTSCTLQTPKNIQHLVLRHPRLLQKDSQTIVRDAERPDIVLHNHRVLLFGF